MVNRRINLIFGAVLMTGVTLGSIYYAGKNSGDKEARRDITQTLIEKKTNLIHEAEVIGRTFKEQDSLLYESYKINNIIQDLYYKGHLKGITIDQIRNIVPPLPPYGPKTMEG